MEKLIVLGTGNAQAVHCYNTCFAMKKGQEYYHGNLFVPNDGEIITF